MLESVGTACVFLFLFCWWICLEARLAPEKKKLCVFVYTPAVHWTGHAVFFLFFTRRNINKTKKKRAKQPQARGKQKEPVVFFPFFSFKTEKREFRKTSKFVVIDRIWKTKNSFLVYTHNLRRRKKESRSRNKKKGDARAGNKEKVVENKRKFGIKSLKL